MATLRELFGGEFGRLLKRNQVVTSSTPGAVFEVPQSLYCDFDACACFLGCYIAEEFVTSELLHALVQQHQTSVSSLRRSVGISGGHVAVYPTHGPPLDDLPFTGRIILYVDATLEDAVKQSLVALGTSLGVWVQIRDRRYGEFVTRYEKPLAFISHDSRDKDTFVRPLAAGDKADGVRR
jgi:hypothetical protein